MEAGAYPRTYGTYTLLELLGKGGMSEVELAQRSVGDAGFVRFMVIKRIHRQHADEDNFVRMFQDEARISAELQHENIAQVYDFGRNGAEWFLAMEYVPGMDLRDVQRTLARVGKRIPLRVGLTILAHVLSALQYAHSRVDTYGRPMNVVHRDVNPRNVMLSVRGEVKLIDFGVAKADNRSESTIGHSIKGKFAYMAPEQVEGTGEDDRLDGRADLFAVGLMLWELVEGRAAFAGLTDVQIMHRLLVGQLPPLSVSADEFPEPERLAQVYRKATARERADRYDDAARFRIDLIDCADRLGGLCSRGELAEFLRIVDPIRTAGIADRLRAYRDSSTSGSVALPLDNEPRRADGSTLEVASDGDSRSGITTPLEDLSISMAGAAGPRSTSTMAMPDDSAPGRRAADLLPASDATTGGTRSTVATVTTAGVAAAGLGLGAVVGVASIALAIIAGWLWWQGRTPEPVASPQPAATTAPAPTAQPKPADPPSPVVAPPEPTPKPAVEPPAATPAPTPSTAPSPPPEQAAAPTAEPTVVSTSTTSGGLEVTVTEQAPAPVESAPVVDEGEGDPLEVGYLNVSTAPSRGLEVYVDGELVGRTPLKLHRLPVGPHEVRISDPTSGRQWSRDANITRGKPSLISVEVK